jgi:hypothetical protein
MKFALPVVLLLLVACEKQLVQLPLASPTPKDSGNTPVSTPGLSPSPASAKPPGQSGASTSPQLEQTPDTTTVAPAPSIPVGSPPAQQESGTPSSGTLPTGGRPIFKNQAANDYLESYDAYIKDFKEAYRNMKQGNMVKYEAVIGRTEELQSKGEQVRKELTSEEQREFSEYLDRKAQELGQSADQN